MRTTREEWAARITRWKASGRTAKEFATELGIRPETLKWWKWRFGWETRRKSKAALARRPSEALARPEPTLSPLTFVEMTTAIDVDRLEVVLPSTVRVRVKPGFDAVTLGRLLDVLEQRR
jgi:transposase